MVILAFLASGKGFVVVPYINSLPQIPNNNLFHMSRSFDTLGVVTVTLFSQGDCRRKDQAVGRIRLSVSDSLLVCCGDTLYLIKCETLVAGRLPGRQAGCISLRNQAIQNLVMPPPPCGRKLLLAARYAVSSLCDRQKHRIELV